MPFIFQADCYCDSCGKAIKTRILAECPPADAEHFQDEHQYDSDGFPKWMDSDEESDSPCHCGSHADCLEAETLSDGSKIGALLSTNLTSHGVEYLREMLVENISPPVTEFWKEQFSEYGTTRYEIVVGNVGTVYSGFDRREAENKFESYTAYVETPGRGYGEPVTMFADGELVDEYFPTVDRLTGEDIV
jgi:hypothetical protein